MTTPLSGQTDMVAELEAAVAAGILDEASSRRLTDFLQSRDNIALAVPDADEEQLRLITGFNDIFVTIGLGLFLGALAYLLSPFSTLVSAAAVAAASWGLAEYFTRKKRMALPSIVLLLVFSGSVLISSVAVFSFAPPLSWSGILANGGPALSLAGLATALAGLAHWLRFRVPITVAAAAGGLIIMLLAGLTAAFPDVLDSHPVLVFLPVGLIVFATAMWFDMSDRKRRTRRTDIAFWLHLLAAPLIVHPVVLNLVEMKEAGTDSAAAIIGIFLVLCFVALVADRRALLVSSLIYLAYAAQVLVTAAGWNTSAFAVAILAVGAIVLLLSVAWRPLRQFVISLMPRAVTERVPPAADHDLRHNPA